MKKTTIGIFKNRTDAEKFINTATKSLSISHDDISYIYKNVDGIVKEVDTSSMKESSVAGGAVTGATTGAAVGALAGLATLAGLIPVVGPIFAAGPLVAALGITGGAGLTAAGAVTGAAVGGLAGALVNLGAGDARAKTYEDLVLSGDILVAVNAEDHMAVEDAMSTNGAIEIETYKLRI